MVRVGGDIREPRKLRHVNPIYPELASRARVQGTVVLECVVSPQGQVLEVSVLRNYPPPRRRGHRSGPAVGLHADPEGRGAGQVLLTVNVRFALDTAAIGPLCDSGCRLRPPHPFPPTHRPAPPPVSPWPECVWLPMRRSYQDEKRTLVGPPAVAAFCLGSASVAPAQQAPFRDQRGPRSSRSPAGRGQAREGSGHVKSEMGWPAAYRKAGSKGYTLAISGNNQVWFLNPNDSYAAAEAQTEGGRSRPGVLGGDRPLVGGGRRAALPGEVPDRRAERGPGLPGRLGRGQDALLPGHRDADPTRLRCGSSNSSASW